MGSCCARTQEKIAKIDFSRPIQMSKQPQTSDSYRIFKAVPIQNVAINLSEVGRSSVDEKTSQRPQWQAPPPVVAEPEIVVREKFTDQSAVNIVYSSDANDILPLQRAAASKANDPQAVIYEEKSFKIQKNPIPSLFRIETSAVADIGLERTSQVHSTIVKVQPKQKIVIRRLTSNIQQNFVSFPQEQFMDLKFDFKIVKVGIEPFFSNQ